MIVCVEVELTIPDNEARTALATLQRLGVGIVRLERAALYRCETENVESEEVVETLRSFEAIFNPNKHRMRARAGDRPGPGEVWIDDIGPERMPLEDGCVRIAGRALPGIRRLERFVAWRAWSDAGLLADAATVGAATETLLCNFAFQKAIRA